MMVDRNNNNEQNEVILSNEVKSGCNDVKVGKAPLRKIIARISNVANDVL